MNIEELKTKILELQKDYNITVSTDTLERLNSLTVNSPYEFYRMDIYNVGINANVIEPFMESIGGNIITTTEDIVEQIENYIDTVVAENCTKNFSMFIYVDNDFFKYKLDIVTTLLPLDTFNTNFTVFSAKKETEDADDENSLPF